MDEHHGWSKSLKASVLYPRSDGLDASITLTARYRFGDEDRLCSTLDAVDRELGAGAFHLRYLGIQVEEGCFLACTFGMAEAHALLGNADRGRAMLDGAVRKLEGGGGSTPKWSIRRLEPTLATFRRASPLSRSCRRCPNSPTA